MSAVELNLDGLVGPTHNYAGLSWGNLASARNKDAVARPRAAALQGLAKMRQLMALGVPQGVLAPQERPNLPFLRALGFAGDDAAVWRAAWKDAPDIARAACAASAMWAANAATVSPAFDCADARTHITPANLTTMLHRALEAEGTARTLARVLPDPARFAHHPPLIGHAAFADEGAANHMRLCAAHGAPGVEVFVYGRNAGERADAGFPGRQTREACEAIARRHGLAPERVVFARQARRAIDAGAFHNDVVAVANERVLFFHEHAFEDKAGVLDEIRRKAADLFEPVFIEVKDADVSLADAVTSYLFNSQLITIAGRAMLIAPTEVRENNAAAAYVRDLVDSGALGGVRYVEVRESMRNGGGPACLRLRVALSHADLAAVEQGFVLNEALADALEAWVTRCYRETLAPADLADPALITETRRALDELTAILPLGGDFYAFQRS
ncbi:MAG: N-succinylarginine dihydrolase [Hydrogenophilaceae bacterium]|jgi:succinylarginine dihydrolase|nr:N-succinylarginine dihydrolase [Hydrogenophilaceae bacterium]